MTPTRQIVLDTETTGLDVSAGHRIIEIGCVELVNRRQTRNDLHLYVNPGRPIDPGAIDVHGITNERLAHEPRFEEIAQRLRDYLEGAELIIHNAPFDLGFLNDEFARVGVEQKLQDVCTIVDTVALARKLLPGQRVSLDALCKRYGVDNSRRDYHGALLDARLLAEVYVSMTSGQSALGLEAGPTAAQHSRFFEALGVNPNTPLRVVQPTAEEWQAHRERLAAMLKKGRCLWAADLDP